MKFSEYAIRELNIGKKATIVHNMIRELIHNQEDLEVIKEMIKIKGSNKIYHCLCRYAEIKNKLHKHSA